VSNYSAQKPDRGGCLNWWLGLSFVFSILVFIIFLGLGSQLSRLGYGALFIIGLVSVGANVVFLYGIYDWKRWGVYGFIAGSIISFVVSALSRNMTLRDLAAPFVQIGLLWYLVNDKWQYFD
jgi:hypothetical protein